MYNDSKRGGKIQQEIIYNTFEFQEHPFLHPENHPNGSLTSSPRAESSPDRSS
jgi:hypothetical protein